MGLKMKSKILVHVFLGLLILMPSYPAYAAEEIIVSAAASLTNVMTEISRSFETRNPGIAVTCNFASSGSLVQQMENGAPVDVFASASMEHIDRAAEKDLINSSTRAIFASNQLVLVVPAQSDLPIKDIKDLRDPGFQKIAVGHPESVPAGQYAKRFLEENGMWQLLYDRLVYANSVRHVLDYVRRGETDAGFVYATDVLGAQDKIKVKVAADKSVHILYPIAVTRMSKYQLSAVKFCQFANGPVGRQILTSYGFGDPDQAGIK